MSDVERIYSLLVHSKGLKTRDISNELDLDKYYVAEILLSTDNIPYWYQDDDFLWFAKEGALKIKETSYKNISAAILGEFMHGHVAVLNNKKSLLVFISVDKVSERSVHNLIKIKEDYSPKLAVIGISDTKIKPDWHLNVECENEIQQLFANVVFLQLTALETALLLNRNVDHPKGLHKVVVDSSV